MTAAKYRLGNLTAIVDANGIQQTGATADVMPTEPLADKWRSFGWHVQEIHGHNVREILDALDRADEIHAQPVRHHRPDHQGPGRELHGVRPPLARRDARPATSTSRPWPSSIEGLAGMSATAPMRPAYGNALVELGRARPDVVVLSADVSNSDFSWHVRRGVFPDRFINVGIAEPCLVDVAAGVANAGRIPFANTFAFLFATRALEAVRTHLLLRRGERQAHGRLRRRLRPLRRTHPPRDH